MAYPTPCYPCARRLGEGTCAACAAERQRREREAREKRARASARARERRAEAKAAKARDPWETWTPSGRRDRGGRR